MHPPALCPLVSPVAPRTPRGLGGDHAPVVSPPAALLPPLLGVLCHLCKYLCVASRIPSCVPSVLGWGACALGPSPCPRGYFGGCSDNPPNPLGCSTHGCLSVLRLGVGLALVALPTHPGM